MTSLPNDMPPPRPAGAEGESLLEAGLLALFDALPVPTAVHDLCEKAATRFVNQSFTRSFGYTIEDVPTVAEWARKVYPDPAERDRVWSEWWQSITARRATGIVTPPVEHRLVDKSGRWRDVLIGFALHGDLAIVTFQDRTETREAEAALAAERRQNEQTAFALTENMPAGAYTMVLRPGAELAEFAFLSRQFLQMLELTREEAVGDPMTGFSRVHPEDRPRWIERNAEAFAARKPFSEEARIIANGQTRWIRAESVPRSLEDGSTIWEGFIVDITDLKETEARLKAVIDASHAFTWKFDLRSQITRFDEYWAVSHGYPTGETEIAHEDWMRDLHPEDVPGFMEKFVALRDGKVERQSGEYRRRHRNGHWIWMQVHAGVSERDAEGRPTVLSGVSFDITKTMATRLRAQEEQAQLREDLQRAQMRDTVAQVAGGVAHDINNLIAVVAGTTDMLEMASNGQDWMRDGLARIRRSVDMAHELRGGCGNLNSRDKWIFRATAA